MDKIVEAIGHLRVRNCTKRRLEADDSGQRRRQTCACAGIGRQRQRSHAGGNSDRRVLVQMEVRNFYPWLRGAGPFARAGVWIYAQTQQRIHRAVTRRFLRRLASWAASGSPNDEGPPLRDGPS